MAFCKISPTDADITLYSKDEGFQVGKTMVNVKVDYFAMNEEFLIISSGDTLHFINLNRLSDPGKVIDMKNSVSGSILNVELCDNFKYLSISYGRDGHHCGLVLMPLDKTLPTKHYQLTENLTDVSPGTAYAWIVSQKSDDIEEIDASFYSFPVRPEDMAHLSRHLIELKKLKSARGASNSWEYRFKYPVRE